MTIMLYVCIICMVLGGSGGENVEGVGGNRLHADQLATGLFIDPV